MSTVPGFRYHPDPVGTGSAVASEGACGLCGEKTGFRYEGPVYGVQLQEICLGCIADGTAADRLVGAHGPAEFTDVGWGVPDGVPAAVLDEISRRTPGYYAWQQDHWLYHCDDGAAYLGRVGWEQVQHDSGAMLALRLEANELGLDGSAAMDWIGRLSVDGDMTAYLFECLHCGLHLAYSDAS
ncbi:CbrC family protein [Kribbella sp. NPDC055071]